MLVPLYGFVEGDTVGVLVLVHDHQTIDELAGVVQAAAAVRVAPRRRVRVMSRGASLEHHATIASCGLEPLDRVDVVEAR